MTEPEVILWFRLKDRGDGLIFKRQKAYGPYILDFYCFAAGLVVEVDGAIHWEDDVMARDRAKNAYLTRNGLHVYRVDAEDIYDDADGVAEAIRVLGLGSGLNRHPPHDCRGDENGREEVLCLFVVSRGYAPKVFEAAEHSLDQVSASISNRIIGCGVFACWVRWNNRFASSLRQPFS